MWAVGLLISIIQCSIRFTWRCNRRALREHVTKSKCDMCCGYQTWKQRSTECDKIFVWLYSTAKHYSSQRCYKLSTDQMMTRIIVNSNVFTVKSSQTSWPLTGDDSDRLKGTKNSKCSQRRQVSHWKRHRDVAATTQSTNIDTIRYDMTWKCTHNLR